MKNAIDFLKSPWMLVIAGIGLLYIMLWSFAMYSSVAPERQSALVVISVIYLICAVSIAKNEKCF